jgi:cold shock CspA family protein
MGWFFKESATVKKYLPEKGRQKAFAFVTLADNRDVYVGADVLSKARITSLTPGQAVKVKHEPSVKRPGTLQATVISA